MHSPTLRTGKNNNKDFKAINKQSYILREITIFKKHLHKITDELDETLAYFGLSAALILLLFMMVFIGRPTSTIGPILIFLTCATYLFIRKNISVSTIQSLDQISVSSRFYIILNIIFFLSLSFSIISIHLRIDPYIRPLEYFIITSFMAAIVAFVYGIIKVHSLAV